MQMMYYSDARRVPLVSGVALEPSRSYGNAISQTRIFRNRCTIVPMYIDHSEPIAYEIERVQTGVRIEKRLLKVMKALADYHDMTLGDLIEGIVLHSFDGKCPFGDESLKHIAEFKKIYRVDLDSKASHNLVERKPAPNLVRPKARPAGDAGIRRKS